MKKLKDILNESVLGDLPSAKMFKYNKATGKYEAPGKHSTKEEVESQLEENLIKEEYVETIDGMGDIQKALDAIEDAWFWWADGPMTKRSDIKPAQKELINYISNYLKKTLR